MDIRVKKAKVIRERMERFAWLPDGWCGDGSYRISRSVLAHTDRLLDCIRESDFIDVSVFPETKGGLHLEWEYPKRKIELLPYGEYAAYNLGVDVDDENRVFRFTPEDSAESVIAWLFKDKSETSVK